MLFIYFLNWRSSSASWIHLTKNVTFRPPVLRLATIRSHTYITNSERKIRIEKNLLARQTNSAHIFQVFTTSFSNQRIFNKYRRFQCFMLKVLEQALNLLLPSIRLMTGCSRLRIPSPSHCLISLQNIGVGTKLISTAGKKATTLTTNS